MAFIGYSLLLCAGAALFLFGALNDLLNKFQTTYDWSRELAGYFAIMGLLHLSLGCVSFLGYWKMKRWGVYLYAATLAANLVLNRLVFQIYEYSPLLILGPPIAVIIGILNLKRMT
jgi:hypothetical protein